MVRIINLEAIENDPNLSAWQDFAERWQGWRAQFNQSHWPQSWQGKAYKEDQLRFPSPWGNRILETRHSIRNGLVFGYVLQEQKQRALLMPGYLGAGHQLEAVYLIREQILLHLPYSLAGSNWFLQVTNVLLPELLNQPQVNPAATAAAMQLSIEGHPNFAHCLLNTYTCLEENKQDIKSSIKIIGSEPIAPLHELFPEYQWLKQHEQSDGNEQEFELPISCRPSVISESLRDRIQQYADNNQPTNLIEEHTKTNERIMRWKQNGGWVLWVSLKTRGAVAHGLKEFIVELIKELESKQCTPLLILDGFSVQQGTSNQAIYYVITLQELIREEISLAAQIKELLHLKGCTVQIIEAIGLSLLSSINLAGFADFYICHQGTVQHKIGWTYWNTPGIVHSNPTRWRTGIHEWGGMGGKAPIWMKKEAITEYQDAKNQNSIHNQNPRRPYQINYQPAIKSVIESLEESGLILELSEKAEIIIPSICVKKFTADPIEEWREHLKGISKKTYHNNITCLAFEDIAETLKDYFIINKDQPPNIYKYSNAIFVKGAGTAYAADSGIALKGSYLRRMPNGMQAPHCKNFYIEPRWHWDGIEEIKRAIYIPFTCFDNFGHFITETLSFLWPFTRESNILEPSMVMLSGQHNHSLAEEVSKLIKESGHYPVYEDSLPNICMVKEMTIPDSTFSLHNSISNAYLSTAQKFGSLVLEKRQMNSKILDYIYISRAKLASSQRLIFGEEEIEDYLLKKGWNILNPQQIPLEEQLFYYSHAKVIAGFEGSAFHALALCNISGKTNHSIIMLGDLSSPDYSMQFSCQGVDGCYLYCTTTDPSTNKTSNHLAARTLLDTPEHIASTVNAIANKKFERIHSHD